MLFTREFNVGAATAPLTMNLAQALENERIEHVPGQGIPIVLYRGGDRVTAFSCRGANARLNLTDPKQLQLEIPPHANPVQYKLLLWSGPEQDLEKFTKLAKSSPDTKDLKPLTRPGSPQWTADITTKGLLNTEH